MNWNLELMAYEGEIITLCGHGSARLHSETLSQKRKENYLIVEQMKCESNQTLSDWIQGPLHKTEAILASLLGLSNCEYTGHSPK